MLDGMVDGGDLLPGIGIGIYRPDTQPQPLGHPSVLMLVEEPQRKTNRVN